MTPQSTPVWDVLIPVVMGGLIGIAGTLIGHFFRQEADDRKELKQWWQNHAVAEGTRPLLEYLLNEEGRLLQRKKELERPEDYKTDRIEKIPLPHLALRRITSLTKCEEVSSLTMATGYDVDCFKNVDSIEPQHVQLGKVIDLIEVLDMMFSVSTVQDMGDIYLTPGTSSVQRAINQFRYKLSGLEPKEIDMERLQLVSSMNIFTDRRSANQRLNKMEKTMKRAS